MSKAVRWQVPFAAHDGTRYRVDIYDEGYTGNPVVLTAGETPFTTDEDDSDDFFAPVRTQTGTLQVCTDIEGSNTPLKLEDILPVNNIARPVRLLKYANGSYSVIEWQGFLSCEAYSQDYVGIPQNLDLPLIGVLDAMASVEVDPAKLSGLNTVGGTINQLLEIFIDKAGVSYFSEYYVPTIARGRNIVSKYIDATILFEQKEYNNENSTTYIVSGLSLQDCLARIATYMGWCLREKSGTLYFMAANETSGYRRNYRQGMADMQGNFSYRWMVDLSDTAVSTQDIDDLDWMGNGHQRSVAQGAKSVEVVAKLEKYNVKVELPECPVSDSTYTATFKSLKGTGYSGYNADVTVQTWINEDKDFINTCIFNYFTTAKNSGGYIYVTGEATLAQVLTRALINPSSSTDSFSYNPYIGAFMVRWKQGSDDVVDGLYIVGIRYYGSFTPTSTNHVFQIRSLVNYALSGGNLVLKYDMLPIMCGDSGRSLFPGDNYKYLWISVQFGSKYWNGTSWSDSFTTFKVWQSKLDSDGNYKMPISGLMSGELIIRVYPVNEEIAIPLDGTQDLGSDIFFKELSISYELPENDTLTDRSENHYFRLLGTNFRDEISVDTDLASSLNNQPSPSLIMNDQTTPMTLLNYGSSQSPDMRRPEVDLLNRLATYYGAARQRLELEVAHISTPLPMLRLNGIDDGKVYLPLAESRDWRTGVCKLTCFECPS